MSKSKGAPKFLKVAVQLAGLAAKNNEVPIGAVIVKEGNIIARAFNQTEKRQCFLAHAEIIAIEKATRKLKTKYLEGCDLYISLEPCQMCRTAAQLSRIKNIFYLLKSKKFGKSGNAYFKSRLRKESSELEDDSLKLLSSFFKSRRKPKTIEA